MAAKQKHALLNTGIRYKVIWYHSQQAQAGFAGLSPGYRKEQRKGIFYSKLPWHSEFKMQQLAQQLRKVMSCG